MYIQLPARGDVFCFGNRVSGVEIVSSGIRICKEGAGGGRRRRRNCKKILDPYGLTQTYRQTHPDPHGHTQTYPYGSLDPTDADPLKPKTSTLRYEHRAVREWYGTR